jgi:hypothetical protein
MAGSHPTADGSGWVIAINSQSASFGGGATIYVVCAILP